MKRKTPVVKLREAAIAWTKALADIPKDAKDSHFAALDRKLQQAAIKFAESQK